MGTQKNTTLQEMKCFFELSLLMTRNKKLTLHEYWSTDKFLHSSIFSEVMTKDRYLWILQMIHFTRQQGPADNRLYKISDLINMLRKSFCDILYTYSVIVKQAMSKTLQFTNESQLLQMTSAELENQVQLFYRSCNHI